MSISAVSVDFIANVGKFIDGLQAMKKQQQDWQDDITGKLNTVKSAFEAFVALEAFKQFGDQIMGAIDNISSMSDAATKLGMSVESYEALAFAAKEVGTDIGTAKTAFTNINKEIENGANGNIKAIHAFNELGLSISALQQMTPEEQFAAIAEAFKKMPDGVEKTALGIEIFKKGFTEIRPLLDQGAEGLANASTNAASLGQLLSAVDVKNVKEAHTEMGELGEAFHGLFDVAAAVFAPFITGVITPFLDWLKESKILFDVVGVALAAGIGALQAFGYASDVLKAIWDSISLAIDYAILGVESLAGVVVSVLNEDLKMTSNMLNLIISGFNALAHTKIPKIDINVDGMVEKIGAATDHIKGLIKTDMAQVAKDLTDGNGKAIGDLGKELQSKLDSVKNGAEAAGKAAGKKFLDGVTAAGGSNDMPDKSDTMFNEILGAFGILSPEEIKEVLQQIEMAKNSAEGKAWAEELAFLKKMGKATQENYDQEIAWVKDAYARNMIDAKTYYEEVAKLQKAKAADGLKDYENQHTWSSQAFSDMNNFAGSMANAIVAGQSLGQAMKKFFADMLTQIAEQIVKWEILKAIQIACGFAGPSGAAFGAALGTATGTGAGSTPMTAAPGRAVGGTVASNTPYMVGENGPELFTPGSSGFITPNNQLGGGGSSANNVSQTFNVQAGVSQTVRAEMMSMMPMFQQSALAGIVAATKRGGITSRIMRGY